MLVILSLGCRRRVEVERAPEDKRLDRAPTRFVVMEKGSHRGVPFFTASALVLGEPAHEAFDLASFAKRPALAGLPPIGGGDRHVCAADERAILCLHEQAATFGPKFMEPYLLDDLDAAPKKLDRIPGFRPVIRADATDWYVLRQADASEWGEIVGISRPGGTRRSITSGENIVSFDIDESYVYWAEGAARSSISRRKKLGGPIEPVTVASEGGEIMVRGGFVVFRSGKGVLSRAPKSGGGLEPMGISGVDVVAHDDLGFCWCSGAEPKVFCRGSDDVSRTLLLDAHQPCAWMAISRSHVVVQADEAMWIAPRI